MNLRFCVVIIGLFIISACGSLGLAQQDANNQDQQIMTPVSGLSAPTDAAPDPREALVNQLGLRMFEAAAGHLSLCTDDQSCLSGVKVIKSWVCIANSCDGTDISKKPFDCVAGADNKFSKEAQDQINTLSCSLIKSPSALTRKALLSHIPENLSEDDVVEMGAALMALKGSAESCKDYIKDYVGPYGPTWNVKWYKALSGCRILAHESTRENEEKDFYTWFGVVQGSGSCLDIVNIELRNACNATGAASPVPLSSNPSVNAQ